MSCLSSELGLCTFSALCRGGEGRECAQAELSSSFLEESLGLPATAQHPHRSGIVTRLREP
jgi:hypothetical protein